MYCPKCGKEVMEGGEFCQNCGLNVSGILGPRTDGSTALAPDAAPAAEKKASKKKIWVIAVAALALVAAVGVGVYFALLNNMEFGGLYQSFYSEAELPGISYEFIADKRNGFDGTVKVTYTSRDSSTYHYDGHYKLESGKVSMSSADDSLKGTFIIYKNYLIHSDYIYEGAIPQGDKFYVTCTCDDLKIIFQSDGTFVYWYVDSNNKSQSNPGTYERKGDVIYIKFNDSEEQYRLLIYNNRISNYVLYK